MTLLAVEGLSKSYAGAPVLSEVGFTVEAGEMVALIGPNGAGKSTCFSIIGGQIAPDRGHVRMEGRDIAGLPPHRLCRLGLARTFQLAAAFGSMSVAENLRLALKAVSKGGPSPFDALPPAGEEALMAEVGIAPLATCDAAELPYGDLKRLELALALAAKPRLLLMDEPTAGMGAEERAALMALVTRLARERGLGVLFTEHDIDMVFGLADRILVLVQGHLVAAGPPEKIRADAAVVEAYLGDKKAVPPEGGAL